MLSFAACKKQSLLNENIQADEDNLIVSNAVNPGGNAGYCVEDVETTSGYDSVLVPTILGSKLNGYPYSVSVMQQAAQQILGNSAGVTVNAWYMRFKPADADQLAALEDNDIDLFDYPLDYELVQEGDYYDDGTNPTPESIPWLYAVVPVNFTAPSGVTSELLQQIHVPDDYRVEKKAFEITNNAVDDYGCQASFTGGGGGGDNSWEPDCPNPCNAACPDYDPTLCTGPAGPTPPSSTRIPAGSITVTDDIRTANPLQAVRNARVVAKRFLKVERTYTNNQGNFQFTKSFRNKVKLIVKFKNNAAIIKGLRGARIWQLVFPVKINIGTFRGNLNNIPHNINDNDDERSRGARHWAAATTHNAVQEYHDFANQLSIGLPPQKVKFLIVPSPGATGAAPMFASRLDNSMGINFINKLVIANGNPILSNSNLLLTFLRSQLDILAGYTENNATKTSAQLCETVFHELSHAAHYNKVGNSWYAYFVGAELSEIILDPLLPGEKPYGDGTRAGSGYIGLGESWAYYMGHVMTEEKYGAQSPQFNEQGNGYTLDNPVIGLNSNLNLLEDFNPAEINDPFNWIPQGLYYDLVDDRNDNTSFPRRVLVDDNVNGYTNQQLFNALDGNTTSLIEYRTRLLQQTNNNPNGVTQIFNFYGY